MGTHLGDMAADQRPRESPVDGDQCPCSSELVWGAGIPRLPLSGGPGLQTCLHCSSPLMRGPGRGAHQLPHCVREMAPLLTLAGWNAPDDSLCLWGSPFTESCCMAQHQAQHRSWPTALLQTPTPSCSRCTGV